MAHLVHLIDESAQPSLLDDTETPTYFRPVCRCLWRGGEWATQEEAFTEAENHITVMATLEEDSTNAPTG